MGKKTASHNLVFEKVKSQLQVPGNTSIATSWQEVLLFSCELNQALSVGLERLCFKKEELLPDEGSVGGGGCSGFPSLSLRIFHNLPYFPKSSERKLGWRARGIKINNNNNKGEANEVKKKKLIEVKGEIIKWKVRSTKDELPTPQVERAGFSPTRAVAKEPKATQQLINAVGGRCGPGLPLARSFAEPLEMDRWLQITASRDGPRGGLCISIDCIT